MSVLITFPNININFIKFSGGELHVQLDSFPKAIPKKVDVRADIHSSDDLMGLLLAINALQNHYGDDMKINVEIPYFPYARQDRVCAIGQAFSLQVVANMFTSMNVNSLTVWDAHSPVTQALTEAINIPQEEIIASSENLVKALQDERTVLVCPDKGAKNKCEAVKEYFSVEEIVYSEKVRDPSTGQIVGTQLSVKDLNDKTAIIIDDICDGGRTFIEIAKSLKEKQVKRVILYVTHGIFSKGLEVFDELIDKIYTTNSFPQMENSKLTVVDFNNINNANDANNIAKQ